MGSMKNIELKVISHSSGRRTLTEREEGQIQPTDCIGALRGNGNAAEFYQSVAKRMAELQSNGFHVLYTDNTAIEGYSSEETLQELIAHGFSQEEADSLVDQHGSDYLRKQLAFVKEMSGKGKVLNKSLYLRQAIAQNFAEHTMNWMPIAKGVDRETLGEELYQVVLGTSLRATPEILVISNPFLMQSDLEFARQALMITGTPVLLVENRRFAPLTTEWLEQPIP